MDIPLVVTPAAEVMQQVRTCRYGHGTLVHVDSAHGKPLYVAMAYGLFGELVDNPKFIGPLHWHICKTCGYMETVDLTPAATLAVMGRSNG